MLDLPTVTTYEIYKEEPKPQALVHIDCESFGEAYHREVVLRRAAMKEARDAGTETIVKYAIVEVVATRKIVTTKKVVRT